jgi:hypothetical protein
MFFGDGLGSTDLEGATDILLPFRPRELSLRFGVPGALEGGEIQGNGVRAADAASQEERLIESPLTEAPGMKRNAEDEFEIGKGKLRVLIFRQESAQRLGQAGCALIFEAMDGLCHQPFVWADGSGLCEVALLGETLGAKMVLPGGVPEAQTAAGAAGVGKKLYSFGTEGTRVIIVQFPQAIAAEEALGGEEEIDQRMPEGGHLLAVSHQPPGISQKNKPRDYTVALFMVWLSFKDGESPVNLLQEQHFGHPVRQGHGRKGEPEVGFLLQGIIQPIGAAEDENYVLEAGVAPDFHGTSKGFRGE